MALTAPTLTSPAQTPSPSPSANPTTISDTPSIAHLDALLESYLTHLDTYTTLRAQLSTQLSSGFFALARANHTSTSRRYGEEGYDERMKAGRRVAVRRKREVVECAVETYPASQEAVTGEKDHEVIQDQAQDMTPDGAAAGQNHDDSKSPKAEATQSPNDSTAKPTSSTIPKSSTPLHRNPLNWYGILVPPSLRQAQAHFATAVDGPIPELLNVSAQMAELETQVEHMRKAIGFDVREEEEEEEEVATQEETDKTEVDVGGEEAQLREESTSPRSPKKQLRLAPRSRVLKLDG